MHFLSHSYLSGDSPSLMLGNFIGEVKTITDSSIYEEHIRNGITLHHLIDGFTNNHPTVQRSRKRLSPKFSKHADIIIDVFYDHFLASEWDKFSKTPLEKFSVNAYRVLLENQNILPYKAKCLLPQMIKGNWFVKYKTVGGLHETIREMDIRSTKLTNIILASEDLIADYSAFKEDFDEFFPQLINYVKMVNQFEEVYEAKSEKLAWVG
jgi:acyl carrier protein phosphodiesterase